MYNTGRIGFGATVQSPTGEASTQAYPNRSDPTPFDHTDSPYYNSRMNIWESNSYDVAIPHEQSRYSPMYGETNSIDASYPAGKDKPWLAADEVPRKILVFCEHRGCRSNQGDPRRGFSRKADLVRHMNSCHDVLALRNCPVRNCSRQGSGGFARLDHLNEHLSRVHGRNGPARAKQVC